MKRLFAMLALSLAFFAPVAEAQTTVAGVDVPQQIDAGGERLLLNGAGVRSKFFIKVYVGALYVKQRSDSPAAIIEGRDARGMHMFMLYKEVSAKKIRDGWRDGFEANLSESDFTALEPRLQQFNALFPALRAGDKVEMNYLPGQGTQLRINGALRGTIAGKDFADALLRVWIGDRPADSSLKRGLLGD